MTEKILSALDSLSPDMPRDDWYRMLAAIKSEMGDKGMDIAEQWSRGSDTYDPSSFNLTWNSLSPNGGINIGTLFHYAGESGWTYHEPSLLRDQTARLKRQQERQAANKQAEVSRREQQQAAAKGAQARWDAAKPADPEHPYLTRKGVKPHGIRQEGDNLLVPMKDDAGVIRSLQTITPDGVKRFAKGGKASGMYYRILGADPIVICEGFATGATINQCTGHKVAIAFSCGNLGNVAKQLRAKYPDERIIVSADSEPQTTTDEARKVAIEIKAELAVPDFSEGESGSDFNDLAEVAGSEAVKLQIGAAALESECTSSEQLSFGLIKLDELIKNVTGTQYLIKPYLERDCIGTLFGDSDTYKSFLMIDFGLHLAAGIDYHGHRVHQCPVVYIAGEGHGGIGRRVMAWLIEHDIRPEEIPFYVSKIPAQLIEEGNALEIAKIIKQVCPENPGMIAIDTLSTNIGDGDESDNKDMSRLLSNVNLYIRIPTGACVPIVAHVGHGDKERERGAYCIRGNVDFRILIKREGIHEERRCSMFSLKTKDGPPFPPASYKAEIVTLPGITDSEGEESTSLVLSSIEYIPQKDRKNLPEKNEQCLVVLRDMNETAVANLTDGGYDPMNAKVQSKDWQAECIRRKIIKGKSPASEKAQFQRIKRSLREASLILVDSIFVAPGTRQDEG